MYVEDEIERLKRQKNNLRFDDLVRICQYFFGNAKVTSSHHHFRMPWPGDPWINLQKRKGQAKPYQVKQVIAALTKLSIEQEEKRKLEAELGEKRGEIRHVTE
jgi:hypothetical protein